MQDWVYARPLRLPLAMALAYRLRVELLDSDPPIWRTLSVPAATPLDRLHDVLQTVIGWTDSHLHRFEAEDGTSYTRPFEDGLDDGEDERGVRLDALLAEPGDALLYEYDFGDGWEHVLVVEAVDPDGPARPACLDGAGACPPEDSGGVWAYNDARPAYMDPSHPDHADLMEWLGGPFDPDHFDVEAVNRALR